MTSLELEEKIAGGKPIAVIVKGVEYGDINTGLFMGKFLYWKNRIKNGKRQGLWETFKPLSPLDGHDKMLLTNIYTKIKDYNAENKKNLTIGLLYKNEVKSLYGKEVKMRKKNE